MWVKEEEGVVLGFVVNLIKFCWLLFLSGMMLFDVLFFFFSMFIVVFVVIFIVLLFCFGIE